METNFTKEKQIGVKFENNMDFSKKNDFPKCGEIWQCDLGKRPGSVQSGRRPVLVASNDKNNRYSPTLNVFPLTTKKKKDLPTHVKLYDHEKYGLCAPSTILVEQPMTVSVDELEWKIGSITDYPTLEQICVAMGVQIPFYNMLRNYAVSS